MGAECCVNTTQTTLAGADTDSVGHLVLETGMGVKGCWGCNHPCADTFLKEITGFPLETQGCCKIEGASPPPPSLLPTALLPGNNKVGDRVMNGARLTRH